VRLFCPVLTSAKYLPTKYTFKGMKGGQGVSPPISWSDVPKDTQSFALTVVDQHPSARNQHHWFVINIPGSTREINEAASGVHLRMPSGSMELRNSFAENAYVGPKPSPDTGAHQYLVTLYALKVNPLRLGPYASMEQATAELKKHILDKGTLAMLYE